MDEVGQRSVAPRIWGIFVVVLAAAWSFALPAPAADLRDGRLSFGVFGGQLTTNGIDDVPFPGRLDFADSHFAGILLGYEIPVWNDRWQIGAEVQLSHHFGMDTYQEIVVMPATIRYSPARPWLPVIDSFAFGIGLSHTTETPLVEVVRRGDSQRTLVYFTLETAFALGDGGDNLFLRLHHRSDAYGLFERDAGSNGFALGWRRSY
jgi:hypothetical protein